MHVLISLLFIVCFVLLFIRLVCWLYFIISACDKLKQDNNFHWKYSITQMKSEEVASRYWHYNGTINQNQIRMTGEKSNQTMQVTWPSCDRHNTLNSLQPKHFSSIRGFFIWHLEALGKQKGRKKLYKQCCKQILSLSPHLHTPFPPFSRPSYKPYGFCGR